MSWEAQIGRKINLRDLHILLRVAHSGSMAQAAKDLAISQPAVSRAISEMEKKLGVPLFDRKPLGVEPTIFGSALVARALAVFDELKHGVEDLQSLADPGVGELTIASTPTSAKGMVTAVLYRMARQHPRAVFQVDIHGQLEQQEKLRRREVELGIARVSSSMLARDIEAEVLLDEPLIVVASSSSRWAKRRKLELAELLDEPWTWAKRGTFFDILVVEAFQACKLKPPRAAVHTNSGSLRLMLAATGHFLAVVPATILRFQDSHTGIKALPVTLPGTEGSLALLTLRNRALSPLAQMFMATARQLARRG